MKHVDKVIVCDDGSKDMTGEIARRLGAEVVYHEKNEG
jgi:glycosyltransferase involved in cell wall biosynthesis